MSLFRYESNNSGGDWWLSDDDWINLEKAGWKVYWGGYNDDCSDRKFESYKDVKDKDRWLGALSKYAEKEFPFKRLAINEFEKITGQNFESHGCYCCGRPHEMIKL